MGTDYRNNQISIKYIQYDKKKRLRICILKDIKNTEQSAKKSEEPSFIPFSGCNDVASLKKRYKELSKSFHPDMQGGDNQSM